MQHMETPLFVDPRRGSQASTINTNRPKQQEGLDLDKPTGEVDERLSWWWWWEIFAAALNLLSIAAIGTLLFKIDHIPLSAWTLPIQPSSLLAVLTTISKTSLLVLITSSIGQLKWRHFTMRPRRLNQLQIFDDASRGPWGSAIMLLKFPFEERTWAWIAIGLAISNVLALGIDPSAQQLISLQFREVKVANGSVLASSANAYFSRTWDVDTSNGEDAQVAFPGKRLYNEAERTRNALKVKAIVYNTIADSARPPFYKCPEPALRCEWEDFSTLGVCSRLRNVTDLVEQSCKSTRIKGFFDGDFEKKGTCKFSVRGQEYKANLGPDQTKHTMSQDLSYSTQYVRNKVVRRDGAVLVNKESYSRSSIGSVGTIRVKDFLRDFNGSSYTAFESYISDFYWCHKEYHNIVASTEGYRVGSTTTIPWGSKDWNDVQGIQETIGDDHYKSGDGPVGYYYNAGGNKMYNISLRAKTAISLTLPHSLIGTPLYFQDGTIDPIAQEELGLGFPTHTPGDFVDSTEDQLARFSLSNDVASFNRDLADAMTAFLLDPDGDNINATMVPGFMTYSDAFFEIQWPWLSVIVLETLLGFTLLVATIFLTRTQPLLKNSVIAMLVYTLSGWKDEELCVTGLETQEKWDEHAKGMVVQFGENEQGRLRFNRVWKND